MSAIEIGGLDDERFAFPTAARISVPPADPITNMRPPVQRDDTVHAISGCEPPEDDVSRRLLNALEAAQEHTVADGLRDAPLAESAILPRVALPAALARLFPLIPRCHHFARERRQSPIRWID